MSNKKNEIMYSQGMNNTLACIGEKLAIPESFTVAYKDKTGANHLKTLTDCNEVALYYSIDRFADMGGKVDTALIHLLGEMYQTNAFKVLGMTSVAEYGASVKHIAKSTTNTYVNIFKTCFNKDHTEKIIGIADFGKGQLTPLVGLLNNLPTIAGVEFTFDTIARLISNGDISADMSVEEINGIIKVLKAFCVPKEWVRVEVDEEGTHFFLKATDEEFISDPRPIEGEKSEKKKKKKDNDGDDDADGDTIKPVDLILKALEVYENAELDDDTRNALKDAKNNLLLVLARIDNGTN